MKEFIKKVIRLNNEKLAQLESNVKTFEDFFIQANESDEYTDDDKQIVSTYAKQAKDTLSVFKLEKAKFEKKYKSYLK